MEFVPAPRLQAESEWWIQMNLDVLYQFNEKYAPYAGVSMTSLLENNKQMEKIRIFILGENLSPDSITRFERMADTYGCEICFISIDDMIEQMKRMGLSSYRGSYAANMRLFLADVLDDSVDRLLYLDADTIVLENLHELLSLDLGTYPLAMAFDSVISNMRKNIGFSAQEDYYNSGVILFQMHKWKEQDLSGQIAAYVKKEKPNFSSPDQDLLNIVCKNRIYRLPPQFNLQPMHLVFRTNDYWKYYLRASYYEKAEIEYARENPVILHFFRFMGEFPWHKGNVHPDNDVFDEYMQISEWSDYMKQPSDANYIMKIEKFLYRFLPGPLFLSIFRHAHVYMMQRTAKALKKGKQYHIYQGK